MASVARLFRRETENFVRNSLRARSQVAEKAPQKYFQSSHTTFSISEEAKSSSDLSRNSVRRVAVFWDLDNKPPKRVGPYEAATRLKAMAAEFGEVVDVVAYANHHAFEHIPRWVHEDRKQRKELNRLEASGAVRPEQPYVCGVCGAKAKTHVLLTKHFKMLHEREHKKRVNRLESLRGKKKQKERFRAANSEKMAKYREAAQSVLIPKVGYGLMQEIRRAGVYVRTVKDEPQAADIALKDHIRKSMKKGVKCICLVSDDTDFKSDLNFAREKNLHVVVVGDLKILSAYADTYFSWRDVTSGQAEEEARRLTGKPALGELGIPVTGKPIKVSEVPVEEESERESEDDDEWKGDYWRPIDRNADLKFDDNVDYGDDSLSDSDSEASEIETDSHPGRMPQHWPKSTVGRQWVQTGLRTFMTSSKVNEDISTPFETEGEASAATGSASGNPQRLHYLFTKLEGANNGQSQLNCSDLEKGEVDSIGGNNPGHFTRVQDILKSPLGEGTRIGKKNSDNGENFHEAELNGEEACEPGAHVGGGGPRDCGQKEGTVSSPMDTMFGRDDTTKPRGRVKIRRSPTTKSRIIKVVNAGPRPYYLSGFTSESQPHCDAIAKYYKEWWRDDETGDKRRTQRKRER